MGAWSLRGARFVTSFLTRSCVEGVARALGVCEYWWLRGYARQIWWMELRGRLEPARTGRRDSFSAGVFIAEGGPTMAPHKFGTTVQSSLDLGRRYVPQSDVSVACRRSCAGAWSLRGW